MKQLMPFRIMNKAPSAPKIEDQQTTQCTDQIKCTDSSRRVQAMVNSAYNPTHYPTRAPRVTGAWIIRSNQLHSMYRSPRPLRWV